MKQRVCTAILSAIAVAVSGAAQADETIDCVGSGATCEILISPEIGGKTYTIAADAGGIGIGETLGQLPFVIITGADASSLIIDANGGITNGTATGPNQIAAFRVRRNNGTAKMLVQDSQNAANPLTPQVMLELRRKGAPRFDFVDESNGVTWTFQNRAGTFDVSNVGNGVRELSLDASGNLTIAGALIQSSDVNAKKDFQTVDGSSLLANIDRLEISKWTYKNDETGSRHIGPTAQDFHSVFGVGMNDKTIAPLDVASVAVAGVKELNAKVSEQEVQLAAKDAEIVAMKERMAELEDSVQRLMMSLQHASR